MVSLPTSLALGAPPGGQAPRLLGRTAHRLRRARLAGRVQNAAQMPRVARLPPGAVLGWGRLLVAGWLVGWLVGLEKRPRCGWRLFGPRIKERLGETGL